MTRVRLSGMFLLALACACPLTRAQAPINSNVALQPSKGGVIVRQQFRFTQGSGVGKLRGADVEQSTSITTLAYGITSRVTLILDMPFVLAREMENRSAGIEDTDSGISDLRLLSKVRLYRDDFGPNNTSRFDVIGGFELPSGAEGFGSDSVDPIVGGVFTHVEGRHAFDADAVWQFNTGGGESGADVLKYDLAYLYRVSPEVYASHQPSAIFGSLELNGIYETRDDHEIFVSPGIQYVSTRWIFEATVQVPVWQDLSHGVERDFVFGVGFRFQF